MVGRITIKELQAQLEESYKTIKSQETKIQELQDKNSILINKCTELENELSKIKPKHNERGAGRKSSLTKEQIDKVKESRNEGLSYDAIAKEVGLSKAYVYKLINKWEHTKNYTKENIARINRLRQGLREMGHTHSLTKDLDIE